MEHEEEYQEWSGYGECSLEVTPTEAVFTITTEESERVVILRVHGGQIIATEIKDRD